METKIVPIKGIVTICMQSKNGWYGGTMKTIDGTKYDFRGQPEFLYIGSEYYFNKINYRNYVACIMKGTVIECRQNNSDKYTGIIQTSNKTKYIFNNQSNNLNIGSKYYFNNNCYAIHSDIYILPCDCDCDCDCD